MKNQTGYAYYSAYVCDDLVTTPKISHSQESLHSTRLFSPSILSAKELKLLIHFKSMEEYKSPIMGGAFAAISIKCQAQVLTEMRQLNTERRFLGHVLLELLFNFKSLNEVMGIKKRCQEQLILHKLHYRHDF